MATTYAALRARCGALSGQGHTITASSGSTVTVVSTGFEDYALSTDDILNRDWWIAMTTIAGTANLFEERPIEDYTSSSTTVTVPRAFSGSIANNDVGELWRLRPSFVNQGIVSAIRWLQTTKLYLPVYDETIIVDNLLANSGMETAGAGPPTIANWTEVGSPTVTQETSRVWHGTSSAKVVASGATGIIEQNLFTSVNIKEIAGKTLRIEGWIHATDADQARLRVTFDGSTYTNGAYHGGKDEWEGPGTMYISATVPDSATEMTVSFEVNDGYTAYADDIVAWIDPVTRYSLPSGFITQPRQVTMQANRMVGPRNTSWLPIGPENAPRSGHRLRLLGNGRLTEPSAETSSIEVSNEYADLLAAKALSFAYQSAASLPRAANRDEWEHLSAYWDNEAQRMMSNGLRIPRYSSAIPDLWGIEYDGETKYLTLTGARG